MRSNNKRYKVIIFDLKTLFPDRTYNAFYESLEQVFDVTYYGPGYMPIDEIEEDLLKVLDKLGPFDACFINKSVVRYLHTDREKHCFYYDDAITQYLFNKKEFYRKKPNFGANYDRLPKASFLIAMLQDFYAFRDWYFEYLGKFPGYMLLPPFQTASTVDELPDLKEEKFYHHCNDEYIRFCQLHFDRMIPLAHMMRDNEFISIPQNQVKRVAIPGVLYAKRKVILNELKANHVPTVDKLFIHKCINILFKTRLVKYRHPIARDLHRNLFIKLISESMMTYTEGSRLKIFLKKFIEIPAYGSLLMCEPFRNAEAFGFKDRVNCLYVEKENIVDITNYYLNNTEQALAIAQAGQNMVRKNHSSSALANTFHRMVELAISNNLKGGQWVDGQLQFLEHTESHVRNEIHA